MSETEQKKIITIGESSAGKTKLLECIFHEKHTQNYKDDYQPTVAVDLFAKTVQCPTGNQMEIEAFDTSGRVQYKATTQSCSRYIHMVLYCIDLSIQITEQMIEIALNSIREFNQQCLGATLLLVGTKCDSPLCQDNQAITRLRHLQQKLLEQNIELPDENCFITSAKLNLGTQALFERFSTPINPPWVQLHSDSSESEDDTTTDSLNELTPWQRAFKKLCDALKNISDDTVRRTIEIEINKLSAVINTSSKTLEDKGNAIDAFTEACQFALNGNHPTIMDNVFKCAAILAIAVITAAIGFTVGFFGGLWSGPGAFISGHVMAVSVLAVSGIAAGLTSYGLFKESKEVSAIRTFAANIQNNYAT